MKRRIRYTNEPMGEVRVVTDFLPRPEDLVFREDTVKVTISLSRSNVDFFKRQGKKHHVPYQRMIRRLLDEYTLRTERSRTGEWGSDTLGNEGEAFYGLKARNSRPFTGEEDWRPGKTAPGSERVSRG